MQVPTTPVCTWWNRPEKDPSSGKLESTHPSRTSVKSDQGFLGDESVMRINVDSLLIRAATTSTSGTLNDLTTDLIMANNNSIRRCTHSYFLINCNGRRNIFCIVFFLQRPGPLSSQSRFEVAKRTN